MQLGVEVYLSKAEEALKNNSVDDFLRFIGNAESISMDTEVLANVLYVRAKGLSIFKHFDSALKAIDEALELPQSERKYIRLLKARAGVYNYTGRFKESLRVLKELMTQTTDEYLLSEIYINMAWTYLLYYKSEPNDSILEEAKFYLDEAYKVIENFDNDNKKRIVFRNFSEYFKLRKDFDLAIEMLEEGLKYCSEENMCKAYNDLAELHLLRGAEGDFDVAKKYLRESEILSNMSDNDFDLAKTLYLKARIDVVAGDFIKVLDGLYTACNSFLEVGAYSNAFDCYKELVKVSGMMNSDFVSSVKEKITRQFEDTGYKELI